MIAAAWFLSVEFGEKAVRVFAEVVPAPGVALTFMLCHRSQASQNGAELKIRLKHYAGEDS